MYIDSIYLVVMEASQKGAKQTNLREPPLDTDRVVKVKYMSPMYNW